VRIGFDEPESGVPARRLADHFRREVDSNSFARFQGGEQVAKAAPDLEHPRTGGDQEPVDLFQPAVVLARKRRQARVTLCNLIPVIDAHIAEPTQASIRR
jgi:hypothetical protein